MRSLERPNRDARSAEGCESRPRHCKNAREKGRECQRGAKRLAGRSCAAAGVQCLSAPSAGCDRPWQSTHQSSAQLLLDGADDVAAVDAAAEEGALAESTGETSSIAAVEFEPESSLPADFGSEPCFVFCFLNISRPGPTAFDSSTTYFCPERAACERKDANDEKSARRSTNSEQERE